MRDDALAISDEPRIIMGRNVMICAAGASVLLATAACGGSVSITQQSPGANPTASATPPAGQSPNSMRSYAQDIINAGINGPVDWIVRTGERLCAEWRSGTTTSETDPILLAGGVHVEHLEAFNRITNNDLCPAVTLPTSPTYTPGTSTTYAQDIINVGINAPVDWIDKTGEQLCAEWRSGTTTSATDQVLLAGGVHADHLEAFNRITNYDLCPDVTPSP